MDKIDKIAKFFKNHLKLLLLLLVLVLAGTFLSSYFFKTQKELSRLKNDLQKNNSAPLETEAEKVVGEIGKLLILPEDEIPTLATITDVEKLRKDKPFFLQAENGDKVLVYSQAKKAILYRPSLGKIVDIAPLNVDQTAENVSPVTPSPGVSGVSTAVLTKVALYNGTRLNGLAKTVGEKLAGNSEIGPKVEIVSKENSKNDYSKTIVVDLKGNRAELAAKIAEFLGGSVGGLPEDEKRPLADILVIIGE